MSQHDGALVAEEGDARRLATTLRSMAVAEIDRRGLILRPSRLPPGLVRPQLRQRLRAALEPLLSADRARLFRLPDQATVVLWRGTARAALADTLEALGQAVAALPPGVGEAAELITLIELPRDTETVLRVIEECLAKLQPHRAGIARPVAVAPLDLGALGTLEQALAQADVAHFARRKPVCAMVAGATMRLAWEKRYLSVAELAAHLVPDHSPQAEPWLFRRLTRTLDRRMLALLSHSDELRLAGPFSLNLNVASILSPHFARFDQALPTALRGQVVLDLLPADILNDLSVFAQARDLAHDRGYRLLLRGVTAELLPVLPIASLGVDLLQLRWSPELSRAGRGDIPDGADRLVMGGADHQDVVDWGLAHGIGLFQGILAQPAVNPPRPLLANRRRLTATV